VDDLFSSAAELAAIIWLSDWTWAESRGHGNNNTKNLPMALIDGWEMMDHSSSRGGIAHPIPFLLQDWGRWGIMIAQICGMDKVQQFIHRGNY
jgi:hypothetical protein